MYANLGNILIALTIINLAITEVLPLEKREKYRIWDLLVTIIAAVSFVALTWIPQP